MAAILHYQPHRFCERLQRFNVPLNRHVAQNDESWSCRPFLQSRVYGHEQRDAGFARHMISQEIYRFHVKIGSVNEPADS
jgi:hypothetical protein